jgi:hypothetical protein
MITTPATTSVPAVASSIALPIPKALLNGTSRAPGCSNERTCRGHLSVDQGRIKPHTKQGSRKSVATPCHVSR